DRFVTVLLGRLDPATRSFQYSSAGHPTGYVLATDGQVKRLLPSTAIPLGVVSEFVYAAEPVFPLESGDLVLFLTDGVVEAQAPAGAPFGITRPLDVIRHFRADPAARIVENLYHTVRAFAQNQPQPDDITVVVLKVAA